MVLTVMIPCVVYVALIVNPVYSLGIYEASAIFIAFFMRFLGKYAWPKIAAVSIGVMVVFFLMFEVWFKVPLPKGPIEALLGLPLGSARMQEIQSLMGGFAVALSWFNLMLMLAGVTLGVLIGVLPGLGGANGVAILLPLTFSMAQQPGRRHLGHHPAVVHLLGRALRRRHHLDPVQHPGRALVGGDHLRRLPAWRRRARPGRRSPRPSPRRSSAR